MGLAIEPQVRWALRQEEPPLTFPFLPEQVKSNRFELDPKLTQPRYAVHELEVIASHLEEMRQAQASVITLRYRDAPLTNVLADLGKQACAEISVGSVYWDSLDWIKTNRVTVDVNRASYWQAMRAIEKGAGLTELFQNLNRLLLVHSQAPQTPSVQNASGGS